MNEITSEHRNKGSNGTVDARVERALTEFFHVEEGEYGDETYRVHSGSGETYAVDLDGPDGYHCSCDDPATFCKHLLRIHIVKRPVFLLECEHGDPKCHSSNDIEFKDGEPTTEGNLPCFECFKKAHREHRETESEEDTPETETATDPNQPVMADGGQELTRIAEGQLFRDKRGTLWKITQRVEWVDFAGDGTEVRCVRLEEVNGDGQEWIGWKKFPGLVNDPTGRFSLVSEVSE